jgi:hypothetical protein
MKKLFWLRLQFFGGEGASAGASSGAGDGGAQAASGENASAAAEQRLRELGVPSDKAKKRASKVASSMPMAETSNVSATAVDEKNAPQEEKTEAPAKMSFDEWLKSDADYSNAYNQRMQAAVTERIKGEKAKSQKANDALSAMTPAIEVMARKYGLDAKNMDYAALAKAIENDDAYYEDKAIELGTSIETAKRVDQMERADERRKAAEQASIEEQKRRNHYMSLNNQADAMRKVFPNFNLQQELQNPTFARMVGPNSGLTVEDAYFAVHRKEIQAASMQVAVQKTAEQMSNAIASGSRRPQESGATAQAPSVTTFDYKNASREQREAFKKDLRQKMARGEKVYVK